MSAHDGQIDLCPHQGCDFACCEFAASNFIVLYPGELDEARRRGVSTRHLSAAPDGRGGHRAICRANDTSICDGGYKPLDCASYPFFPTIVGVPNEVQAGLKGEKCPLQAHHLSDHRQWVIQRWQDLASSIPQLGDWIRAIKLVGYARFTTDANEEELVQ